jgi:hypothetical protein
MDERPPPSLTDAINLIAAQIVFWGLVAAMAVSDFEQLAPFALVSPFAGAYCIWATVRFTNRVDDLRRQKRPPDAP